jgi:TPR repeat protein
LARAEERHAAGQQADAAAMFRALADEGNVAATLRLAQLYARGRGVLQNFDEALRWYAPPLSRVRCPPWRGSVRSI